MQIPTHPITKLLYWMLILVAIVVGVLRIGFANIDYFKSDIEKYLEKSAFPGLVFSDIELGWDKLNPLIHIHNAALTLPNQSVPIKFKLNLEVSLWGSLLGQSLVINGVDASIESLHFRKDQNQHWWLGNSALNELISGLHNDQPATNDTANFDIDGIVDLIPKSAYLNIKQIIIDDESSHQPYEIENSTFKLQRDSSVLRAELNTNILTLGAKQRLSAIYRNGKGIIYANLNNLDSELAKLFDIKLDGLQQVKLSGDIWLNLDQDKPPTIQADLSVNNGRLRISPKNPPIPFLFDTHLSVSKKNQDWMMVGKLEALNLNDQNQPGFEFVLNLTEKANRQHLSGWINQVDLSILPLLAEQMAITDTSKKLISSQLKGQLNDLWFSLDPADAKNLSLSTQFTDISNQPILNIPGINQISGSVIMGQKNLQITTSGQQLALDFSTQLRAPIAIDNYALQVNASFDSTGTHISIPDFKISNSDMDIQARLLLDLGQTGTPGIYLNANFGQINLANTSKYLPVQLLSEDALAWFDKGIQAGEISSGKLLFHRQSKQSATLEPEKPDEIYAELNINKADIMFSPKWDSVRDAHGIITYHNQSLTAKISKARFGDLDEVNGQISIADLSNPQIDLDLHTTTEVKRAISTSLATPVAQSFKDLGNNFEHVGGQVKVNIKLSLPLKQMSETTTDISLDFDNASIRAAIWKIDFSQINGQFKFSKGQIVARDIKAQYFGDPITINIDTNQASKITTIDVDGLIQTQKLLGLLPDYAANQVSGKSHWNLGLAIHNERSDKVQPRLQISAESDLKNTRISFPSPLSKSAESTRKTKLNIDMLNNNTIDFDIHLGSQLALKGGLEMNKASQSYQLKSVDIGFSTPPRPDKNNRGVRLYGSLPQISIDDWLAWYQSEVPQSPTKSTNMSALDILQFIELKTPSILIQGQQLSDVYLLVTQEKDEFLAQIKSSHIDGIFAIPKKLSIKNPIVADLEYIKYEPSESKPESEPEAKLKPNTVKEKSTKLPSDFYPLSFSSKKITYSKYTIENVKLEVQIKDNIFAINHLDFQQDKIFFTGKGEWKYHPLIKKHTTELNFGVNGTQFGQAISAIGVGEMMTGGEIKFDSQFSWSESPLNFDWDSLTGNIDLSIKDGILNNINIGSARLIGLFNFSALPRRLLFGFGDVVTNGLEFDEIEGSYSITGGTLTTNKMQMNTTAATVLIDGSTDLQSQTFDQTIYITPKIRQTLPVIGGLAISSGVGWGLLLIQGLFRGEIDSSVEIQYAIQGPWADPKIESVKQPKQKIEKK